MIVVNKDKENDLVFTLNEKDSNTTSFYLLELTNTNSKSVKYMPLGVDISTCSLRYNQFKVTEDSGITLGVSNEDLENQIIALVEGFYDYKVYSNTSLVLVPTIASIEVETGKLFVPGVSQVTEYNEQSKTNIIYYGN